MSARIRWTPPALACPHCGESAPSPQWAIEEGHARCPCCSALAPFHAIDVTDW